MMRKSKLSAPLRAESKPPASRWVRDSQGTLYLTALFWSMVVLLLVLPHLMGEAPGPDTGIGHANPFNRTVKLAAMGLAASVVFRRRRLAWIVLRNLNRPFILFLLLIPLSILWSIDPGATVARYVSVMSYVTVCFAMVLMSWDPRRFQRLLRPLLLSLLAASLLYGIVHPELAIEHGEGTLHDAWRGLSGQKNEFGMVGSLSLVIWFHALLTRQSRIWMALAGCAVSGLCVFLSRSSTSLFASTFTLTLLLMLMRLPSNLRRYLPWVVGSFAAAVVIYAVAVLNIIPGLDVVLSPFAAISGKDLTFSNRSAIWDIVKEHIALSPWYGSGYGAYWTGEVPTSASYVFLSRMYFYPSESHNGYLEVVNDLGFVGLTCLLAFLFQYVRQSLQLMRIDRSQAILYLSLFFQQAVANLSESSWFAVTLPFSLIIMTLATCCLARTLVEARFNRHLGSPGATPGARRSEAGAAAASLPPLNPRGLV